MTPAAPPPGGDDPDPVATLSERYHRIVHEGLLPRPGDVALRVLDVVLSAGALITLSPVMGAIALTARVSAGAPVLYRGRRVGRAGSVYTMYKFRTLTRDAETRLSHHPGPALHVATTQEHTRIGRVLRATQLDELPQLYNVLRGDMSLVGPRPIRPTHFVDLTETIPQYWQRLVVRPGMTGFAQLRLERELSWSEKLAHDLEYIADRSVRLYLRVVANTALRIGRRVGAVLHGRTPPS